MSEQKSTEQRLTQLERFAEATAIRQDGEDQLHEGVNRLSDETNALNAILNKVDEQQRHLVALDRRTELVEETAVSRDELINAHGQQEEDAFNFRKKTLKRIYLTGMLIALSLFGASLVFIEIERRGVEKRYEVCSARNEESDILHDILVGLTKNIPAESTDSPNVTVIRDGIKRLEAQIVDCEELL